MPGYYELKRTGEHYLFTLKAPNGDTLLTSNAYTAKGRAEYGIIAMRKHSEIAASYERKLATSGAPFFTLKSSNGERVARSKLYSSLSARERAIRSVMRNGPSAPIEDLT